MKIGMNTIFYQNTTSSSLKEEKPVKKSVLFDHRDVVKAVKEGTMTVDGVVLELSEEVKKAMQEANEKRQQDNETVTMMNVAIHNANVAEQQKDAIEDEVDRQAKAMEIARRISGAATGRKAFDRI